MKRDAFQNGTEKSLIYCSFYISTLSFVLVLLIGKNTMKKCVFLMKTYQYAQVKGKLKRKCGRKYFDLFSLRRKRILLKNALINVVGP